VGKEAQRRKQPAANKLARASAILVGIVRRFADSRESAPRDVRPRYLKVITAELALSLGTQDEEAFYMETAHKVGLTARQLERLMHDFAGVFVSEIRKARLSHRARRALRRYPPVTAEHSQVALSDAVGLAKAVGGQLGV
jgi:hypothetical protein